MLAPTLIDPATLTYKPVDRKYTKAPPSIFARSTYSAPTLCGKIDLPAPATLLPHNLQAPPSPIFYHPSKAFDSLIIHGLCHI